MHISRPENKALKPLDEALFAQFWIAVGFAKGSGFNGMVDDVVRLDEMGFGKFFKEHRDESSSRGVMDTFRIDVGLFEKAGAHLLHRSYCRRRDGHRF